MIAYQVACSIPRGRNDKALAKISQYWPIPLIDGENTVYLDTDNANEFFNKAMKLWQVQ